MMRNDRSPDARLAALHDALEEAVQGIAMRTPLGPTLVNDARLAAIGVLRAHGMPPDGLDVRVERGGLVVDWTPPPAQAVVRDVRLGFGASPTRPPRGGRR